MAKGELKMKYLCVRVLYPDTIHDIPCQSLIGIHGSLEYEPEYSAAVISDPAPENLDLYIPVTQEQYLGIMNALKVQDLVDTNLYGFYYQDDGEFERMYDVILERNKRMELK